MASSQELELIRVNIGDLFNDINSLLVNSNIRLRLLKWEVFDPSYKEERKQDEYAQYIKKSDIFIALFKIVCGKFTLEEIEVAFVENNFKRKPDDLYIFIQDTKDKRNFCIDDLINNYGKSFKFDNFENIKELKLKLLKLLKPYINIYDNIMDETEEFVEINKTNLFRK